MPIDTSILRTYPILAPQWNAPKNIKAYTTLRYPGQSDGVYTAFNLALHVGDKEQHVIANRQTLIQHINLPATPKWLEQTHSSIALLADTILSDIAPQADATYTQTLNTVCAIITADCLPILVTNKAGSEIAAIHAGWKGLAAEVIENTLSALASKPESLIVWIGPSISQAHYTVGEDVYTEFSKKHTAAECNATFIAHSQQAKKWLANLPLLATQRLIRCGVAQHHIYLSGECTYSQAQRYFSYRRDGVTGRMASLIWIG